MPFPCVGATHREELGTGLEDYRPPHGGLTMLAQATGTPFHPPETPKLPPQALSEDWTSKVLFIDSSKMSWFSPLFQ